MKILNIFLIAIFTSSSVFSIENKIYTPFGMSHRQPPRASTITLIEAKMSVSAKQVCGYTDWSTMQIKLPMHLLSKNYWEGKLNALKDEAIKAVLNMVGALPGMIVCNVSPTFCSIYNQSELMAGFEGRLTMDTCKMLEGVQNQDFLQSTPLKECIQKKMQSNTGKLTDTGNLSAGQAREECIFEAGNNSTLEQKMDKIGSHVGPKMFNVKKFITSLFPNNFDDQVKEYKNDHAVSGRTFSRNRKNYNFATTLFSGIELAGSSFVEKAGTFQPSVETLQAKEAEEMRNESLAIIREMKSLENQQHSYPEILRKTKEKLSINETNINERRNQNSRNNQVDTPQNRNIASENRTEMSLKSESFLEDPSKDISSLYRITSDGSPPYFLIEPEQLLALLPLVDKDDSNIDRSEGLKKALNHLANVASYIKMNDSLSDIYIKTIDQCSNNMDYQDNFGKKNCNYAINKIKASIEILNYKRENEARLRNTQKEIQEFVGWEMKNREPPLMNFGQRDQRNNTSIF